MLLAEQSPEIFPKYKAYFSVSSSLNRFIFAALTNKKLLFPL